MNITVTLTQETLAQIREYCAQTGKTTAEIIEAADLDGLVNDMVRQFASLRQDIALTTYDSLSAAEDAAAQYWAHQKEWQPPLGTRYLDYGTERRVEFESPLPLPENVLRMPGGGFFTPPDDFPQEEINRMVEEGRL